MTRKRSERKRSERVDYSAWLTKQQAATSIGVSTKTIEKLATKKQLHQATRSRPGAPPLKVYHPDDVERLRQQRNPGVQPFVVPDDSSSAPSALVRAGRLPDMGVLLEALSHRSQTPQVRIAERLFLRLAEASDYSGLPRTFLRRLMQAGRLNALKTGRGWRIRRADLDALAGLDTFPPESIDGQAEK